MDAPDMSLRPVPDAGAPPAGRGSDRADVSLLGAILLVFLVPIAGQLAGGHWGQGTLGLAAAGALLSAREIAHELGSRIRTRG